MTSLSGSLVEEDGHYLFHNIDLHLHERGWTCLLGPSGVGKTTILRLFAGLDTHGTFEGNISRSEQSGKVTCSYMAQQDLLLPWLDVVENIQLGARLRGDTVDVNRANSLINQVGLADHISKTPSQLSGGMRQRVALARTLMEDQDLVLLDEPFSALDAKTRAEMQELAFDLLKGRTVLLVTHDPNEAARLGDANYILDENGLRQTSNRQFNGIGEANSAECLNLQATLLSQLRGEGA
jgi:putative hydroxymethylpyrimidine transport system ATP-binding protein